MEYMHETTPSVSVDELEIVMSRFIEFTYKEKDKGRLLLDDELFDA